MASNNQKPPVNPTSAPPPPAELAGAAPSTKHSNETPIPDYGIPTYEPPHPHFAPPHKTATDDFYNATPTTEHPPAAFPAFSSSSSSSHDHHSQQTTTTTTTHEGKPAKAGWSSKLAGLASKAAVPLNALANKMGSEAFFPQTMDKECEKAARILKSFCKDGIYTDAPSQQPPPTTTTTTTTKKPRQVLLTIPPRVIARAQGLAIFTTMRAGFQVSGASGSGILIARLPDGSWSPPSGIQVHSVGAGFVIGLDIYDCVVVINTQEALKAFTQTRMSLGSDLAVTAGPWGAGGSLDFNVSQNGKGKEVAQPTAPPNTQAPQPQPQFAAPPTAAEGQKTKAPNALRDSLKNPVYSYVKSRGFYAGVQIDGTVVTERKDANAAFYGRAVPVDQILRGEVPAQAQGTAAQSTWPAGARGLMEVLKGAQSGQGAAVATTTFTPTPVPAATTSTYTPVPPPADTKPDHAGMTTGIASLNINNNTTGGPSTTTPYYPPPPPLPTTTQSAAAAAAPYSKEAEAAAESARNAARPDTAGGGAPPSYTDHHADATDATDAPPAYEDDFHQHVADGDRKTGQH
ncbi:hypothetical protein B0T19DRAFT_488718 [Cercophora scortea]|uniref:Ysc84 actin-binding domain-containing protein n=1 Tax=Cercophora scortea TaxID=314031 RepID=A0AAE0I2Z0_9PEZI|nr:hypothetical protein B0T19DRAFT_488718 [Cercophora scortea]